VVVRAGLADGRARPEISVDEEEELVSAPEIVYASAAVETPDA
jgi:hypothetical protein